MLSLPVLMMARSIPSDACDKKAFRPIPVPEQMLHLDLWLMLGVSAALGLFVYTGRSIGKVSGVILIALYVVYVVQMF